MASTVDHLRITNINKPSSPTARPDISPNTTRPDSTPFVTRPVSDFPSPFGKLNGLDREDYNEAAYEVFFTACRSSPGFGGRNALTYYNPSDDGGDNNGSGFGLSPGSPARAKGVGMALTSRVKRALGLKMLKKSLSSRRTSSCGATPLSPMASGAGSSPRLSLSSMSPQSAGRLRRPLTSAEIMRQQMRVSEQSDNRLRKTLMRTLVGQMGRRAETIILPLELLRHLKPSEFNDAHEYHIWQIRQLKILEAGLLIHPLIPIEKSNTLAMKLRDIIHAAESKPVDTGKNSENMKTLINCVVSLAWRSPDGGNTDVCHWADGYPLNVQFYMALLYSIFDLNEETSILDEVDELLELMKKTWSTLGINRSIHNLCFTWVLFEQYVMTGQVEPDLLGAAHTMLNEVANDAKKVDREPIYVKMLACVLSAMKKWLEKRLQDYHGNFDKVTIEYMESFLPLVFSATKILEEDVPCYVTIVDQEKGEVGDDTSGNRVDFYIRSSLRNAFAKMLGSHNVSSLEAQEASEVLIKLARATEELASKEKDIFSPVLKKWHPIAAGVAAVTLHNCYGSLLNQYLMGANSMLNETILVLQRAGKLEKVLVHMVVEDSTECEDGGKAIVREMVPYEVDSLILKLLKQWIQERVKMGKEHLQRTTETETWKPKSKTEPYAHSATEVIKYAKETVENFFDIPINVSENLVSDLSDGLEHLFRDYITFVSSCGTKQSYLPTLPPLTRSSQDSKFVKLWKKAACSVGVEDQNFNMISSEANNPRPSTSRGTQRLYIRLNSLHYLLSQLHSLDKLLSLSPKVIPAAQNGKFGSRKQIGSSYFENSRSAIEVASQHVSEVAAYRLMFLDSHSVFYGSLYVYGVANSRINPALKILKQNLTLLCAIVTDRAQSLALKEVMKASFEAYLMVLLAGGSSRIFHKSDHPIIEEDFENLKKVFCTCGEGLMVDDVIDREAETVEGVVGLISQPTEKLIEDFTIICEASGICMSGSGLGSEQKLPMPPTTGKWSRTDPNTLLRILCYRKDPAANYFLKTTFQLAKRRASH